MSRILLSHLAFFGRAEGLGEDVRGLRISVNARHGEVAIFIQLMDPLDSHIVHALKVPHGGIVACSDDLHTGGVILSKYELDGTL